MGIAATTASRALRIGLLGGSFDPVHNAHLALARTALQSVSLDRVEFLPAASPWQRAPLGASPAHRLAMLELATRDIPGATVNPLETQRTGPTYTVDTLRALGAGDTDTDYCWLLGSDQLVNFCTWHAWDEIIRRVTLVVVARPGSPLAAPSELERELQQLGKSLHVMPFSPSSISASEIRRRLASNEAIDGLTPAAVVQYIKTNHLYQA